MFYRTGLFVLLMTTAISLPAFAVETAKKSLVYKDDMPVVVITPLKTATDIDKVPFAVSVVDKEDLKISQAQSIDDALQEVPNFTSAGGPRTVAEEPSLRGLSDRRIVIKIDGIRRNFRAQYGGRYFIDPYLIDNIEVVRGSNSAIDGSGAIAGVIQIFTPTAKKQLMGTGRNFGSEEKVGYQSANHEISTLLSGYGQTEKMDLYTAFSYREGDDVRAGKGQEIDSSSSLPRNGLVKAGYNFTPTQRAELRFSRFYDKSDLPANPFQPISAATGNFPSSRESAVTDYSLRYNFTPENSWKDVLNLSSVFYRSEYAINSTRDFDRRLDETDFDTNGLDVFNTAKLRYAGLDHKLVTGVEYFTNKQNGRRNSALRASLGDGEDSNLGLYAQQETTFWDRLTITPGVRFDHYNLEPGNPAFAEQSRNEISPKLGANLKVTDEVSFFGSVASAFRTPTFTELYATGVLFPGNSLISNPNLKPETGVNKEIGIRYKKDSLFARYDKLNLTTSVFQNDVDDYIEQIIGPTTTQFRNVSQARLRGLEVEGRYRVNKVGALLNFGVIRGQNETLDQPLADVPQNRYSAALEYYAFENTLTSGVRASLNEKQDRIPPGQPLITTSDSSTTFDVYGSYTPQLDDNSAGSFRVDFGVDNVFDKNYRRQLAFLPESGRNAKVTLNWKF